MMKKRQTHSHAIDFLFPVSLLLVFAICAIMVVLMATKVYRSTVEHSTMNYTSETSLAYITEKIHQNDADGAIYIGTFDGRDALVMEQAYGDSLYYTYIYQDGSELKELYVKDGTETGAADGTAILEVQDFVMRQVGDGLYRFTCIDEEGNSASAYVGVHSR